MIKPHFFISLTYSEDGGIKKDETLLISSFHLTPLSPSLFIEKLAELIKFHPKSEADPWVEANSYDEAFYSQKKKKKKDLKLAAVLNSATAIDRPAGY